MSNYEKLKELAEATKGWDNLKSCWPEETEDGDLEVNWFVGAVTEDDDKYPVLEVNTAQYDALEDAGRLARYYAAANPSAVLALIADLDEARNGMKHSCAIRLKKRIELLETQRDQLIADNERLTKAVGLQVIRRFVGDDDQKNIDELVAAGIQVDKELIVQLKAENERLAAACERAEQIIIVECKAASLAKVRANLLEANRDQLRAEVAGLKTGYEAYERVNAELKAEVEALREEVALDDKIIADRDRLLNMFDCPAHGQCIPYAMEQIEALRKDAGRYQWLKDPKRHAIEFDSAFDEFGVPIDSIIDAAMGKGEQS